MKELNDIDLKQNILEPNITFEFMNKQKDMQNIAQSDFDSMAQL